MKVTENPAVGSLPQVQRGWFLLTEHGLCAETLALLSRARVLRLSSGGDWGRPGKVEPPEEKGIMAHFIAKARRGRRPESAVASVTCVERSGQRFPVLDVRSHEGHVEIKLAEGEGHQAAWFELEAGDSLCVSGEGAGRPVGAWEPVPGEPSYRSLGDVVRAEVASSVARRSAQWGNSGAGALAAGTSWIEEAAEGPWAEDGELITRRIAPLFAFALFAVLLVWCGWFIVQEYRLHALGVGAM